MASMTMAASFLGGSAAMAVTKQPSTSGRRGLVVMAKASKVAGVEKIVVDEKKEGDSSNGRREMMFGVAAAAAFSMAKVALADDEPKRGTEAAKKKYYPICVTMPTARVCHN